MYKTNHLIEQPFHYNKYSNTNSRRSIQTFLDHSDYYAIIDPSKEIFNSMKVKHLFLCYIFKGKTQMKDSTVLITTHSCGWSFWQVIISDTPYISHKYFIYILPDFRLGHY